MCKRLIKLHLGIQIPAYDSEPRLQEKPANKANISEEKWENNYHITKAIFQFVVTRILLFKKPWTKKKICFDSFSRVLSTHKSRRAVGTVACMTEDQPLWRSPLPPLGRTINSCRILLEGHSMSLKRQIVLWLWSHFLWRALVCTRKAD